MQEFLEITGGAALSGSVQVSGAKNAALPIIIATLLTSEPCTIRNVPNLEDVNLTIRLLQHLGAEVEYSGSELQVVVPQLSVTEASYSLVKALRASFWVLGPLLARGGAARVALPGGDIIGARPVDMHLEALTKMGADIRVRHGVVYATAVNGLKPAEIDLRYPSVGATHQIIMAAARTPGVTTIRGAAREPEIVALADFVSKLGVEIEGAGLPTIVVRGQEELGAGSIDLIGDRIEAASYLLAGLATRGSLCVRGVDHSHLTSFLEVLEQIGAKVSRAHDSIELEVDRQLCPVDVVTGPFPEFATDLQAPLMAALATVPGESSIRETVFEGRFGHVSELCRMGADLRVEDRTVRISGVGSLTGARVDALDIRAGAALFIAALGAEGTTSIFEPQHLWRGYSYLEQKLRGVGARVGYKINDPEDYLLTGC